MHLESVCVRNYRRLRDVRIEIDPETSIFVGANNSGKTSAAQVLEAFLGSTRKDRFAVHDFSAECWNAFDTIGSLGVALGRDCAGLDDGRRFGVGFTRLPGEHTPKDPLFQRAVYRAGFIHAVLPSRQSNGSEVKEWALTAGIGLPVQVDRGYIDGLVEFGKRGDADTDLSETFLRLGFSVTFGKLEDAF